MLNYIYMYRYKCETLTFKALYIGLINLDLRNEQCMFWMEYLIIERKMFIRVYLWRHRVVQLWLKLHLKKLNRGHQILRGAKFEVCRSQRVLQIFNGYPFMLRGSSTLKLVTWKSTTLQRVPVNQVLIFVKKMVPI